MAIPDAGKIFVRLYPGPLSQVIEGMDAILRMPGGCFEQTSSSTYPNVLALDYMKRHFPDLHYSPHVLMEVVRNELSVSMHIWRSRRIVEQGDSAEADHLGTGDGASNRNLEHVFSLLAVIFPREPVTAAYQALHQPDHMFRALALEYLENVLPQDVRERLWALIKETPVTTGAELAKIEAELVRAGSTLSAASKSHAAMLPAENGGEPEPDSR